MTDRERDPAGTFGALLQRRLAERRWSGRELARRGLNQQTVRNMLAGRKPRVENVVKVAQAFDDELNPWLKAAGYPEQDPADERKALRERLDRGADLLEPIELRVLTRQVEGILIARGYIDPEDKGESASVEPVDHSFGENAGPRTASGPVEIADDPAPDRTEESDGEGSG